MIERLTTKTDKEEVLEHFILDWHQFIIDYWWRKRYNVPFGSQKHRSMNFIDMAIEYKENEIVNKIKLDAERFMQRKEDEELGIVSEDVIKLSNEQIDEDYDNIDLSDFDK